MMSDEFRPDIVFSIERYSPERKAEFLLSNAVDERDYEKAADHVRAKGLNPDAIPHRKPEFLSESGYPG
ncbi:MAG: hypothetical protein AB1656_25975 [Candidatus Omnitrophota bacterium]